MALKVGVATPGKITSVGNNYGMQNGASPQTTAPVKYVQHATPTKPLQAAPIPLQGGNAHTIQPAATAAQVAAAAEQLRVAAAAEVARQKRTQAQGQLDTRVAANKSALELKVADPTFPGRVAVGRNYYPAKIKVPKYVSEDPEYDRIKEEARQQAMKLVEGLKSNPATSGFDSFIDKVTFGADRRASGARKYAEEQANAVADRQVKVYEGKLDTHNKLQASLQADYEAKKLRLSATELNALADQYNAKIAASVADLRRVEAYTVGTVEGYGLKAEEKLTSKAAGVVGSINRNVIQKVASNPIWKYTLGEGDKNVPSLVTLPSRVINYVGNINTKDRQIYKYGGDITSRVGSSDNAWQSTHNQRNFNIRPVVDKPFSWVDVKKEIKKDFAANRKFESLSTDAQKEAFAQNYWSQYNREKRNQNSAQELAADPLNIFAAPAKYVGKLTAAGRAGKYTSGAFKAFDKVTETKNLFKSKAANNKIIKWLGAEAKSPEEALADAIKIAKSSQFDAQTKLLPRLTSIDKKLSAGKMDFSVFDDFARLSDSEAKILQRMKAGKLTARDRLMLAGKNNQPIRETLEKLAAKWDDFAEQMRSADRVQTTRFGKGNRTYSPSTAWTRGDLKKYNFRLKSKGRIQSAEDFSQGAVDRYIKSDLGKNAKNANSRLQSERDELLKRYDDTVGKARSDVDKYYQRTKSPLNKVRKVIGAPTRIWKKSVLKYRPAWTVNNVAYNEQAGLLAAGAGFASEQVKMLNPRYARKAFDEIPASVRTNLAKEIGSKGRLNKFYAGVENNPRVAAFRVLKKQGLSDDAALKRVNKYFFDSKTKNWERPIKAVMPFWQWQKNLTKAAAQMPFDRPAAAIGYNRLDRHQQQAFEKDFETVIPKLKELGYTDSEIEAFKQEQAKYYAGRLKVGSKYLNTPFNAFSERGLTSMGFNPYLAAAGEAAEGVDSFGRKVKGNEASFIRRLTSKFPQAELGYKRYKGYRVDKGLDKPSEKYIGKEGSEGYGLTKEKQGYDPSKPNYVASMDPRTKTDQDLSAFFGKPRDLEFDKDKFVKSKLLQKVTAEYFSKSTEWKNMDYDQAEVQRNEFFKKYGMTSDDFFKGVLAKYDSDHTKKIKGLKEDAAAKNKSLFEEYAQQPAGTKNLWATNKLRELTKQGYFDDNPFLKSFKWVNKDTVHKADKQKAVRYALKTGDWSSYRKLVGINFKSKSSPFKIGDKYFKTAASMERYQEGQFWQKYIKADKSSRKQLLVENPQYNRRADWTSDQWDAANVERRAKQLKKLKSYKSSGAIVDKYLASNKASAGKYAAAQTYRRSAKKKVAYV